MNSIRNRLRALEGLLRGPIATAVIFVPADWDEDDRQDGIAALTAHLPEPVEAMVLEDPKATAARLFFVGDLEALLDNVASNSTRIGCVALAN